eukprot:1281463-Amphidinium_carterae.1
MSCATWDYIRAVLASASDWFVVLCWLGRPNLSHGNSTQSQRQSFFLSLVAKGSARVTLL